jgi:hypothetical protein
VSELHSGQALGAALRRAYGAALYLDATYAGIAGRVDAVIGLVPADDVWTSQHWLSFSTVVRRLCLGLPVSDDPDAYGETALRMLVLQLGRALDAAHAALVAEQRRRWTPGSAGMDPLPDVDDAAADGY